MEDIKIDSRDLVQLARLALTGGQKDIQMFVRRLINRYRLPVPELSDQLGSLLRKSAVKNPESPLRRAAVETMPVDLDSRLQLARTEDPVQLDTVPVWQGVVQAQLNQIIAERRREAELLGAGLHATRSVLFTGAPGVGKTLAAKWIARELDRPLVVLDLAAVMSSFLGRTGNNVRNVIDYAKSTPCVFLIDEFDAIAKRRDDQIEVGELKRLVTVLLQSIDEWPPSGLLIAATNHPDLLDPAVWRRFEVTVSFPMPDLDHMKSAVQLQIGYDSDANQWTDVVARALNGLSFAEAEREMVRARRHAVLEGIPLVAAVQGIVQERARTLDREARTKLACSIVDLGISQHKAHEWTGVSRDTIRKGVQQ
jgi:SpoVK/Ycf46/Vps4 family AAA+-type ATPase